MRLIVGFPLYHQVPVNWFSRWLAMEAFNVEATIVINGAYITVAMEMLVAKALQRDNWDRLVIYEHDMVPPVNALTRIAQYQPEHDIVGCMYFKHDPPHHALVYIEEPDTITYNPITPMTVKDWCDDPRLYQVDGVGFGFTSIARHVLENWNPDIPMFHLDHLFGSHDLWFCHQARQQGYRVFVDSGIRCQHLSQIPIGYDDNQQMADTIDYGQVIPFTR
jgi:hypothetical protein